MPWQTPFPTSAPLLTQQRPKSPQYKQPSTPGVQYMGGQQPTPQMQSAVMPTNGQWAQGTSSLTPEQRVEIGQMPPVDLSSWGVTQGMAQPTIGMGGILERIKAMRGQNSRRMGGFQGRRGILGPSVRDFNTRQY